MIIRCLSKIVILLLLLCTVRTAFAQQLQFEQFTTANDLPSERVYNLYMDHKGYVWACTNFGVAKYKGNSFVTVCSNAALSSSFVYCMYEDKKNVLWYADAGCKIFRVDNDTAIQLQGFARLSDSLSKKGSDITNIMVDDEENVFFNTPNSSFELIKKQGYKCKYLNNSYRNSRFDYVIFEYRQHALIIKGKSNIQDSTQISYKTINLLTGAEQIREINVLENKPVRQVMKEGNDLYFFAGNALIKACANGQNQPLLFAHAVLSITRDEEGNVWAAVNQEGMYEISPQWEITGHYFPDATVNCVLLDDQSGMWVSTSSHGIYHCKNIHDFTFGNYASLAQPVYFTKQIGDVLFAGTSIGELFRIGKDGIPKQMDLKGISKLPIGDMVPSSDGTAYYIGCRDKLLKADTSFKNVSAVSYMGGKAISSLQLAYKGNELYNISRKTLMKVEADTVSACTEIPTKGFSMIDFENNSLLIGTAIGVYQYKNDSLYIPPFLQSLKGFPTNYMKRDAKGDIWLVTSDNGLFRLQKDHHMIIYPKLSNNILINMFSVNDTTIGLCLNTGIFITPLSKINDPKSWYRLNNEESDSPTLFNHKLYATTNSGLVCFNLENLRKRNNSKLYFTKAVTDDSTYYQLPLTFRHDQNKIEFHFDLLDYTTNKQRLFYRLESESMSEKGTVEGTQISFRKLAPGNYTLTVGSAISLFYTNEKALTVSFVITPAFWQTRWFIAAMVLLSLILLVLLVYLTTRRAIIRERQKSQVTRMLAEYKLTALKAQINPHFISNSLSAIQLLILDDEADKAGLYLSKFSLLIRYVLKYSDKAIVKLSEELEVIDLNIQLEALRFKDDFKMKTEIADDIDPQKVNVPPLIMQPFIENAIWHGLLPLKGKRSPKLTVSVSKVGDDILISICDNGVGRLIKKNEQRESRGTRLIFNRLENINLMLGTKTAMLTIDDLHDADGAPAGTRVNITVPGKLKNTEYDEN